MSSNLSFLLSVGFVLLCLLYGGDLACINALHNELDAVAMAAGYKISMAGYLTDEVISFVEEEANAIIYTVGPEVAKLGESLIYMVEIEYQPIVISQDKLLISVRRSAVIGYYA